VTTTIFAQTNRSLSFVAREKAVEHTSRLKGDIRTIRCEPAVAKRVYGLFSTNAFLSHFEKFTSTRKKLASIFTDTRQNNDTMQLGIRYLCHCKSGSEPG
jgi:hypothetical protein